MKVVSNTTPIIAFSKIDSLFVLEKIFGEIVISEGVYEELLVKTLLVDEIERIKTCSFIKVKKVSNEFTVKLIQKQLGLDLGESESIVLTDELKADILIMDERKGRKIAQSMGLNLTGTLGVIKFAKEQGIISSAKELIDQLIKNNMRISKQLYKDILKDLNEE